MRISKETLKGYLLEEALAYSIIGTGNNILIDQNQGLTELKNHINGLVFVGRGGKK
jgi:hypothetical protein